MHTLVQIKSVIRAFAYIRQRTCIIPVVNTVCCAETNLMFHLFLRRIILVSHRPSFIFPVSYPPAGLTGPTFIATHAELCCERNVPSCKQGYKQHISWISLLDCLWSSLLLIGLQLRGGRRQVMQAICFDWVSYFSCLTGWMYADNLTGQGAWWSSK